MIQYVDITNFMTTFITSIKTIINGIINILSQIQWNGISLIRFIITITVLGTFLDIVMNSTRITGNKIENKIERKKRSDK